MGTNTGLGIGIGIPFKNNALGGDKPYFPPELKARLIGVWDNYGKKNTDANRNIIKNKIPNAGGDLEILNAAYEGMSGYNGYPVVFGANKTWEILSSVYSYTSDVTSTTIHITRVKNAGVGLLFSYVKKDGALTNIREIPAFRVTIKGLEGNSKFGYRYLATEDATGETLVYLGNGTHELSKSFTPTEALLDLTRNAWVGIFITPMVEGEVVFDCDITIEVLPEFEGAFVTDGIDDLITSTKAVQEMGITDEVTVVSMIHQIDLNSTYTIATTNYIENSNSREHVRSDVYNYGKTGIYGYSASLINNTKSDIKNILGDEADYYVKSTNSLQTIFDAKFSVVGRISELTEASQVAWYWTFIANKVLTTDQINQVIAYFNLDRTLKPDILCNVKKQGITNENHAEFGDKLIDYSGNGRDIQLNNIAWKGDSGIGKYEVDFASLNYNNTISIFTATYKSCSISKIIKDSVGNIFYNWGQTLAAINSTKIQVIGLDEIGAILEFTYLDESSNSTTKQYSTDGIYDLPASAAYQGDSHNTNFRFSIRGYIGDCDITITQIPSHAGALYLDGVNDFGKVTGMPIYKDYTFIIDYERISYTSEGWGGAIVSKSPNANNGAFISMMANSAGLNKQLFSFGGVTAFIKDDLSRILFWQTKYKSENTELTVGEGVDGDTLWLGTLRDNDSRFFNGAIYSLMSFPYSMSEFLIERQLKKHKLGTLYADMVEFRPIIKSNIDVKNIVYLDKDSNVIKVGDYVSIGNNIKTNVTVPDGYKISKVSSTAFNNITIEKSNTDFIYDVIFYGIKKSPQKINLVIEQDSDYVQWNPNIKANVSKYSITANIRKTDGTILKLVNGQFYSTSITGNLVLDIVPSYKDSDEVTNVVIDGKSYVPTKDSSGNYYRLEIPLVFPKEINITIQEYVRYEDIVQPYPVLLRFKDENNNEISWGDKIKLGSSITRIGSFNDCNLLKDIYTVSNAKLNGSPLPNTPHVVERQMIFTCTATWIFDDNEPNCILSPRLLRIPNSSYKILRHIPDISGHGNHGVIYNSAYAEGSGVNEDGSYQFDGVDDFVTIPTLSKGGKQVLMKVNWQKQDTMLYSQNPGQDNFAIFTNDYNNNNLVVAYASRNNGNTYIDGVVNNNILATQLKGITHNIVATNNNIDATITPIIGSNKNHDNFFAQMSLYDFMLFDEISTDDKIKELNTYIGITPKVTLPNYYWDNYGKKNTDANRGYIDEQVSLQKTGTSVNPLENFNISYEGMSGYNGYPVVFGANKTWANKAPEGTNSYIYTINDNKYNFTQIYIIAAWAYSYIKQNGELTDYNKDVTSFKIKVTGLEPDKFLIKYNYLSSTDATVTSGFVINSDGIYELPKSFANDGSLIDNHGWVGFGFAKRSTDIPNTITGVNVTIEVLPEYENGLAYDGVSDFTDNKNIPIFTDFTAIIKRVDLDAKNDNSTVMFKGNKIYESNIGNGFILDYCYNSKNYVYSYGKLNQIERDDSKIIYLTPESYNGNPIIKGENEDNLGLVLGKYWKGIIYKTILYSKTISLLEINFLKNLMEKDEIININHPIFISNTEDESNTSQDT